MADPKEDLRNLSDEDLDKEIEEGASDDESTPPEDQRIEMEESTEEASEEESTSTEEEIPDYVPEQLRDHYKSKNIDELAKAAGHFQKQVGDLSEFIPMIKYMQADPAVKQKVISVLTGKAPPPEPGSTEQQSNPLAEKVQALRDEGLDSVADLVETMGAEISTLKNQVTGDRTQEVNDANDQAIKNFNDDYKLDQSQLVEVLSETEKVIRPSGRKGEYTKKDIETAFMRLYPDQYRQRLENSIRTQMSESLNNANNANENLEPSASAQHDSHISNSKRLDASRNADEFADNLSGLTDEELDDDLEKAGIHIPKRWSPGKV